MWFISGTLYVTLSFEAGDRLADAYKDSPFGYPAPLFALMLWETGRVYFLRLRGEVVPAI